MENPVIRVEHDGAASDRLVGLCLRHPLPDWITSAGPGIFLVDLPPDVKVLVHVTEPPNLLLRTAAAYRVYIYRNDHDRTQGFQSLQQQGVIE